MTNRSTLSQLRRAAIAYAESRWPDDRAMLEWFVNVQCPQAVDIGVQELRWIADQIERIEAVRGGDNG